MPIFVNIKYLVNNLNNSAEQLTELNEQRHPLKCHQWPTDILGHSYCLWLPTI